LRWFVWAFSLIWQNSAFVHIPFHAVGICTTEEYIMNRFLMLVCASVVLLLAPVCHAELIGYNCAPDGDGAISLNNPTAWTEEADGSYTLAIDGTHAFVTGQSDLHPDAIGSNTAHMEGDFFASDPNDPTVTFMNSIDNDTGFTWTGYNINLYMNTPYTILSAAAIAPGDWTVTTSGPTWNGSQYVGQINYAAGTPVADGGTIDFKYKISFTGSTIYSFTQEMTPVPEPGMLALLSVAGLFAVASVRKIRRK
jgi:hypothetical protein